MAFHNFLATSNIWNNFLHSVQFSVAFDLILKYLRSF